MLIFNSNATYYPFQTVNTFTIMFVYFLQLNLVVPRNAVTYVGTSITLQSFPYAKETSPIVLIGDGMQ